MSLTLRIYLSMGAFAGLVVLIGTFGSLQTNSLANTFIEYRKTAKGSLTANAITEDLFEARIASLKYRATKDDKYIRGLSENIQEIQKLEAVLSKTLMDFPDSPGMQQIGVQLDAYEAHMQAAFDLQTRRDEVVAEAGVVGKKAREQLSEIMETALTANDAEASSYAGLASSNLLLARLYLERFLVDNRPGDAQRSSAELDAALEGMSILLPQLQNPPDDSLQK
jgi:methyl-accepting chemotaxis protein